MVLFGSERGGAMRSTVVLALCAVFFVLATGITLLASSVYRHTVAAADQNDTQRIALSYLVNQIRRGDRSGGVAAGTLDGADAVLLTDGDYVTYLYCWDGQLRELYMKLDAGLSAGDGVPVAPLASLHVSPENGTLHLAVTDDNGTLYSVAVTPRSGLKEVGGL